MKRKATIMDFWANNGNNKRPTNTEESSTGSTIEAVLPCSSISNVTTETSNLSQTRLDDLALINIESDLSAKLWDRLPSLVMKFAQVHKNSKIPLL